MFRENVVAYIMQTYGDEPEYLWKRNDTTCVFRHSDTKKWYAALLSVPYEKLGLAKEGIVDILDLKCDPLMSGSLHDGKGCFPGYHMNKEHWITLLLDGTVNEDDIIPLIDLSFDLTDKK
ncbi:MAG: MmcQ/YjbR family DNA-binding protein [Clostridia bacterium]|nr:MmcQ/YjbR family DNA-binding protein [Clostridia bacterium]